MYHWIAISATDKDKQKELFRPPSDIAGFRDQACDVTVYDVIILSKRASHTDTPSCCRLYKPFRNPKRYTRGIIPKPRWCALSQWWHFVNFMKVFQTKTYAKSLHIALSPLWLQVTEVSTCEDIAAHTSFFRHELNIATSKATVRSVSSPHLLVQERSEVPLAERRVTCMPTRELRESDRTWEILFDKDKWWINKRLPFWHLRLRAALVLYIIHRACVALSSTFGASLPLRELGESRPHPAHAESTLTLPRQWSLCRHKRRSRDRRRDLI